MLFVQPAQPSFLDRLLCEPSGDVTGVATAGEGSSEWRDDEEDGTYGGGLREEGVREACAVGDGSWEGGDIVVGEEAWVLLATCFMFFRGRDGKMYDSGNGECGTMRGDERRHIR